jgi:hypothetical protein
MEGSIMPDIYLNNLDGIPFGNDAGRPANPAIGQPYFNGQASRLELYTSATGWQNIVQETPAVVNVVGQLNETLPSTITINGTNFAAGATAYVVGTDGVEIQATSTNLVSVVEITAVFPAASVALEPYDVKVVNPSNLYGVLYETLSVNNQPIWSTASGSLGTYLESQSMSVTVAATDTTDSTNSPLSYSISAGSLPGGLSLNSSTGVISGTPTSITSASQVFAFTVSVTDGKNAAVTRTFSITITDRAPSWSTAATLPTFTRNSAYSTTVVATDDDGGSISYSITDGSLPTGLSLNSSTGVISGTPTSALAATFTIRATESVSGNTADRQFTMPNASPVWTTSSLTNAVTQLSYSFQLVATDDSGVAPTYSISSGSLPAGFSLSSSGLITGSTSSTSSQNITFRVTDANGNSADRSLTFTVVQQPVGGTLYQTVGTYSWTAPANVFSVQVVAVGGGGGGASGNTGQGGAGGGLGWKNGISVTPGQSYTVVVGGGGARGVGNPAVLGSPGGTSYFINTSTVAGFGGAGGDATASEVGMSVAVGGGYVGTGGGNGGNGGLDNSNIAGTGGGGAGGYAGNGGQGGNGSNANGATGGSGSGGAGGGGGNNTGSTNPTGGGGGVGVYGQGASGSGGGANTGGGGGSGGNNGSNGASGGGSYGGGGGGSNDYGGNGPGANGAVRIIWGPNRAFPTTNVGQNYNGVTETVI